MEDRTPEEAGVPRPLEAAGPYAEWEATLAELVATGGTTMLLGGVDVGKTTFTRLLVNRTIEAGRPAALLDADVGQSEIGPPACIGLAFVDAPVLALSDLSPQALAFVGSTSPQGHLLEHASGVRRLADLAAGRTLIIDTSGYVQGGVARRLNQTEFDLLGPAQVVGLQRAGELAPILAPMRKRLDCRIHTPPIPAVIARKTPAFRAQRRAMRFSAYFQNAALHTFTFEEVALVGTWLGGGVPVAAHLLKFLNQALGPVTRVYYAEQCDRHLGLMVHPPLSPEAQGLSLAHEQLKTNLLTITVAPRLRHLLVGLEDGAGRLLGLGLLEALDFRRRSLGILTPVRAPRAARILHFGTLRLMPDGTEIGSLRPGEL